MNKENNYFLGLDIGTGSVGWAVTNEKYELLKKNRKLTWGSVLFNTANGSEERRGFRCARRRWKRVKERISLLQELFKDEIEKVDSGFYLRMKESRYVYEDKRDKNGEIPKLPYSLFVDSDYNDKDYYRQYPTIYHLRMALITKKEEFDVRLVYLAIDHILKHRGHFLSNVSVDSIGGNKEFEIIFEDFLEAINEKYDLNINVNKDRLNQIEAVLLDKKYNKSQKEEKILGLLNIKDKYLKEIIKMMVGGTATLKKVFLDDEFNDDECKKICFDSTDFEENEEKYIETLGDNYELILKIKNIFNWAKLADIIGESKEGYISEAKVKLYEKHKNDLKILKEVVRKYSPENYKKIFGIQNVKEANYSSYVRLAKRNDKKVAIDKGANKEEFYKYLKTTVLNKLDKIEDENVEYIKEEIEKGTFLPKQRSSDNSVIPYQLHELELVKILENASRYLEFLNEKDKDGLTVKEKIHSIMTFKIPYYIGPLNNYHSDKENGHAWVKRKEDGNIYPWNFEQKIDIEESATRFIDRMTSKCTYLKEANVLPKKSLLYEKFMVLNEINNLRIKGKPITVELKQDIYHKLFERHKKVTRKRLIEFLQVEGYYNDLTKEDISGIDGDFKNSLTSYMVFKELFNDNSLSETDKEDIIRDITLFGADEKLLKKRLNRKYPGYEKRMDILIRSIKSDSWGKLSKEFLEGEMLAIDIPGQGKVGTIMYQLWNTNNNMMQLLSNDFPYIDMLNKINGEEKVEKIDYELVKNLYVSPATKRQIWKSIQVVREVERFMGKPPKRIFVEMAREKQESKRSVTRKDSLMELYKRIKNENIELYNNLKGTDNDKLRKDKLYLYYTQMGKCAYSGVEIKLSELMKENGEYDIDHIYPQSQTADDSLDNRVLVSKTANQEKTDIYPIASSIRSKMYSIWKGWMQKGLISKSKFDRLTGTEELTREQLMNFVNKQLVETRQSTKSVTEVLRRIMPEETEIVFVKAKNVSEFRRHFDIIKVRDMNDYHHAKDAYLNIVVGNSFHLYFTKDIRKFFMEKGTYRSYNLKKLFDQKDIIYKDECAWRIGQNATIKTVKDMVKKDKVLITRQLYERRGQLFDVMPLKKGKGQIPLKRDERLQDISKYGGYNSATITYFSLVEGKDKKGKVIKYILPIPLIYKKRYENDEEWAIRYIDEELGSKISFNRIIKKKLLIGTLVVYKGFKMRVASKSDNRVAYNNANEVIFEYNMQRKLKELFKFQMDLKEKKDATINEKSILTEECMKDMFNSFKEKMKNSIYTVMYENAIKIIENGEEGFDKLSIEDKAKVLLEIFKLFQCTPEMPSLALIGGGKSMGAIRTSQNITDKQGMIIINQSITGIYESIERITEEE